MDPEVLIGIAAVFVSGGAIGSVGTLLAQWLLGRLASAPPGQRRIDKAEREAMRAEMSAMHRHLRNVEARLDFTERLLDGAIPIAPAPARIEPAEELGAVHEGDGEPGREE